MHTSKFHKNDRRIKEINELRIASGLSPLIETKKTCGACKKEFLTFVVNERRCSRCKHLLKEKSKRYNV